MSRDAQQTWVRMPRAPNRGTRHPEMAGTVAIRWICMEMMVYYRKSSRFGSRVLVERVSLRVCLASLPKLKIWMEVWFGIRKNPQNDIDGFARCTSPGSYSQIS
jgi:hypothetical protein